MCDRKGIKLFTRGERARRELTERLEYAAKICRRSSQKARDGWRRRTEARLG
jgi:hypothetical protein